ncbi:MAG: hypothetical protein A3F72_09360 [Bacteroidetes bacterium RIFCSPLOWO2_12_FULL_35_15]|nr:MAG: hypothetical protein A3F72_09360 [Bacteroidetes bacterium RIFCSPLOWO2_12_FULL_35_15]
MIFSLYCIPIQLYAQGQCLGGGCTGGSQYPSSTQSSNTNSWTTVSTVSWAGEYAVYNVTNGSTYEWSLLAADGGSASYDAQLTLLNSTGSTIICFSDDYSGLLPKIQWTATFTGTVRVLLNAYSGSGCQTNTLSTTIVWHCSSCGSGSAPANDNCSGATVLTPGASCTPTAGNVTGATQSVSALTCSGFTGDANDDVWYKFTATATLHAVTVVGSASFDAVIDVRSGACNGANINCADITGSGGTEVINLTGLTVSSVYYVRVYDYGSGAPATSTFTICVTTPSSCSPYYSSGTSSGDFINRVQLGTIDNTPAGTGSTGGASYNDYYSIVSTTLQAGTNQNLTVTVGTYGGQTVAAWIDYNNDGDYSDAGENLGEIANIATSAAGILNFTIPSGTAAGAKRMRIRTAWSTTTLDPCASYAYGEAEDYKINITAACTTPGTPASLSTSAIGINGGTLNWSAGTPAGSATVTYYWALGSASNVTYEANYLQRGTTTSLNSGALTGLNPGTTYYWTVKAITSCDGTISAYAAAISFTTSCTTPSSPTALNTTNISTTSSTLNWSASAGSPTISYKWAVYTNNTVSYGGNQIQQGITTSTSVNIFGLTPGTTYWWTVRAVTSCNATESANAAAISFATSTITITQYWFGNTNTDWNTASNWSTTAPPTFTAGSIPGINDNVQIPAGRPNYPLIGAGGFSINNSVRTNLCKTLTINVGASMTITSTLSVDIQGTFDLSGTFNHQPGSSSNIFQVNSGGAVTVKNGAYLNIGSTLISGGVPAGTINGSNDLQISGGQLTVDPGGTVYVQDALKVSSGTFYQKNGIVSVALNGVGDASDKVSVSSGATFKMLDGTFRVSGDNDGTVSTWDAIWFGAGSTIDIQGGTIELSNGTTANDFTLSFAQATSLNNLIINKTGKSVLLDGYNVTTNSDITISAGTFNANGFNITAAGNWANSGTYTAGTGSVTFTGASKTISGNSATVFNTVNFNSAANYTLNSAAAVPQATFNGTFTLNTNASFALAAGNVISLAGASDVINGTLSAVNAYDGTRDIGLNNAAGQLSGTGSVNADLQVSSGATTLMNNFTLNGDFFMNTGTFSMSTHTFTVNGSWTNNGTFTSGTGTVVLGGSTKNITGTSADGATSQFNNLTIQTGASYTFNPTVSNWNIYGSFNNAGTVNIAANKYFDIYSATVDGESIVLDGTIIASSVNNLTKDIDINNTVSLSGTGSTTADIRIYGGTTTLASDFILNGDFIISNLGPGTFTMTTQNLTIGGSWQNFNTFNSGTGTVKFTGSVPGIIEANGNYNGSNKTTADFYNVIVDRSADTLAMKNTPMKILHDFTLTGGIFSTGWHTQSNGNAGNNRRLTVLGFATIGAGSTFFVGYRKACSNPDEGLSNAFCGCCNTDSLNVPVFKGDFYNYGNVRTNRPIISAYMDIKLAGARISGTGVANEFGVDFQVETALSATQVGPVDIQGDLIVQDNTSFINTNPNNVLTVRGNFYMYYNLTHNGTVNCYRDFTSGSTTFFNPNTVSINNSIFNFYQTGALRHIFLKATAANPIYNFGDINVIAGAGNVRELRQRISVSGNLVIQSGTLDAINSGTTSSGGSISPAVGVNNASIVLSGTTSAWTNNGAFIPHSDTVSFTGSGAQTMGGSTATTFYNLTINKSSSSEVTFANAGTVTNLMSLSGGYIVTNPVKLLIMADQSSVTPAGGQSGSFVRGPVKKIGREGVAGSYSFLFPIGKNSIWARLNSLHWSGTTATTDAFTCEYFDAGYGNYAVNAPLNHVSIIEYWDLAKNSGDATLNKKVRLYSEDKTRSVITAFNNVDLTVAHWNGTKWDDIDNPTSNNNSGNTAPAGWITSSANNSFSPFTFGSRSSLNPLPIELLSFTAKPNGSQVDLFWTTSSELNNDYFNVERSIDATTFESIATVQGAGNSNQTLNYSAIDNNPKMGLSYYRLKQVDYDGNYTYSQIVPITIQDFASSEIQKEGIAKLVVYPNPTTGIINVSFDNLKEDNYQISILDMLGNMIQSSLKTLNEGNVVLQFDLQDLPQGVYILVLQTSTKRYSQKIIVQH